jgi:hypothetical protein
MSLDQNQNVNLSHCMRLTYYTNTTLEDCQTYFLYVVYSLFLPHEMMEIVRFFLNRDSKQTFIFYSTQSNVLRVCKTKETFR